METVREGSAVLVATPEIVGHSGVTTEFSAKFASQRPDVAKAFVVALVRGARALQGGSGKSEANLAIMADYLKLAMDTVRSMDPFEYDPDLAPDTDTLLDMQRVFMAEGQLTYSTLLPAERLVDASFSKYAAEKLGPYKRT